VTRPRPLPPATIDPLRARGAQLVPSLALVILDGWGLAPPGPANGRPRWPRRPIFDDLWARYPPHTSFPPRALTSASRSAPDGQLPRSATLNLGGGARS